MNVHDRVSAILRVSRASRNSDRELILIYMQKAGMGLSEAQMDTFRNMASVEAIRRERQKFQEKGMYPADESVNEARYKKFKQVKQNINYDNPEKLIESQGKVILEWGQ